MPKETGSVAASSELASRIADSLGRLKGDNRSRGFARTAGNVKLRI